MSTSIREFIGLPYTRQHLFGYPLTLFGSDCDCFQVMASSLDRTAKGSRRPVWRRHASCGGNTKMRAHPCMLRPEEIGSLLSLSCSSLEGRSSHIYVLLLRMAQTGNPATTQDGDADASSQQYCFVLVRVKAKQSCPNANFPLRICARNANACDAAPPTHHNGGKAPTESPRMNALGVLVATR